MAAVEVRLFNKWTYDDVLIHDMTLRDYLAIAQKDKEKYHQYLPHTAGRYNVKRFRKAQCPIVERLTNSLMMHGRNNGKKLLAVRIVKHAFEVIHILTGENPLQVLVNAIMNGKFFPIFHSFSLKKKVVLVKIPPELVALELLVVKLLMFPHFAV